MSDRVKMFARLFVFLVVVIGIGAALYFAFFRGAPAVLETDETPGETMTGGLPGSGTASPRTGTGQNGDGGMNEGTGTLPPSATAEGGPTLTRQLTNAEILAPTVTVEGTVAFYDPADGRFYTISNDGDLERMSEKQFPEAEAVTFSSDASTAVIEFPDGSNVVYGFDSGKQITLPSHWEDFSFSTDGDQIAGKSIGSDPTNRSLVVTSADGSQTHVVAALGENDDKVQVNWSPSNNVVAFSRTGSIQSSFGRQQYYLIGLDGEASGILIVEGSDFSAVWAPDGQHVLYSVADASEDYRPTLWYADGDGDRGDDPRMQIALSTWVDKCTFASSTALYCAVPDEMVNGGGSNHALVTSNDSLYRIDLPSGRTSYLGYASSPTQMFNLSVADDQRVLYFQDEDGKLNSMRLE